MTKKMKGEDRKSQFLDVGAKFGAKYGVENVTRHMIATQAGVTGALVSVYLGNVPEIRTAIKKHMKKLGLVEPDKAKIEKIGIKLRAHGPRDERDTRKRSPKEVKAIQKKTAGTHAVKRAKEQTEARKKPAKKATAKKPVAKKSIKKAIKAAKAEFPAAFATAPETAPVAKPARVKPRKPVTTKVPKTDVARLPMPEGKKAARLPKLPPVVDNMTPAI